jgi:hypothetical protein
LLEAGKKEWIWVEEREGMKNGNKDGGARVITEKNAPRQGNTSKSGRS